MEVSLVLSGSTVARDLCLRGGETHFGLNRPLGKDAKKRPKVMCSTLQASIGIVGKCERHRPL